MTFDDLLDERQSHTTASIVYLDLDREVDNCRSTDLGDRSAADRDDPAIFPAQQGARFNPLL